LQELQPRSLPLWIVSERVFVEDAWMELGILLAIAAIASIGTAVGYLLLERHQARFKLDNYGRPPGVKPLKSFVCPTCLKRSYAPQHIKDRYCAKCNRSYPEPTTEGQ
jgi:hypothetical protein